ncbi:MAG: CorA family divalent cation transporter, partial [Anaerolineaceae bacterium]|nr:CorA family divalent cation transporter [Anaerolineaceae bacterium]
MISYIKNSGDRLVELDSAIEGCWINVIDPTSGEIEELTGLGIPLDFITYSLDIDERPRTEREDDGTMLILIRIPYFQGLKVDVPYTTIPLGIILRDGSVVTVCRRQNEIVQELASGRVKGLSTAKRNRFVLRILLSAASKFLA